MTDAAAMDAYLSEPRDLYRGRAMCVVRPKGAREVASVLAFCSERSIPVVPQGGNTGLVGGQTPDSSGRQIVLSLQRLDRVREVDPSSDAMTLEAGVTLLRAQEIAQSVDRYFPLSLASEGSCTIGGNLATNAGGVHVLAYGAARDLALGVEVALADGRLLSTLGKLRKDNTGYNLTQLFVGSEGTLGIITAATLKLFPRPRSRAVALLGLRDPAQALALLNFVKDHAGPGLQAFELMPRIGLELVLRHIPGARDPLGAVHPWYALVEIAGFAEGEAERVASATLSQAIDGGFARDAAMAHSLDQAESLWRLRENLSEAQKREGGSIKHDISVPIERIPAFIAEAGARIAARFPNARPVPFGHMGDGNLHYNVSQPIGGDKTAFLARWDEMNEIVHGLVHDYGGSISAEHGVGQLKRDLLPRVKDQTALDVMRALKTTLDPKGVLNPGKLL
ncbi:FAD-binding oxidoreductase [Methylocystis parvus]|uniref:FAD-binding oxidoreductase n=1 Tax=Methylocystis parvus TaxID=134 RepID=A0A6B8M2Q9_9HYPH|nr:FAD-binding oxidoreductase [Methylocystis parvus]QGM96596.1 FAD-binding oxidoreductase [Methylocystis parvus]WBJ99549.1 FAD-binding oxidoreductase [Methylocystis parvus OBBP]